MFKSLGPVSFVIDDKISRLLTTRLYGWDGWVAWSTHFQESGLAGAVMLHGWVGVGSSAFFNFIQHFNEDGAMLLMRRTGWARTYISRMEMVGMI
jgi:hypothetical protein